MKFYDLHCHTSGISKCCRLNSEEILLQAKNKGYNGIVLTNHYTKEYLGNLSYGEWIEKYISEFKSTKKLGEKLGVEVIFGVEVTYEANPKIHILLYGATPNFLRENPELYLLKSNKLYELCHKNGICVIHAHPFRNGTSPLPYTDCDGYEINCHPIYLNTHSKDIIKIQNKTGCIVTCGSDFHGDTLRAGGGTYINNNIKTEKDLADYLLGTKQIKIKVQEVNSDTLQEYTFKIKK